MNTAYNDKLQEYIQVSVKVSLASLVFDSENLSLRIEPKQLRKRMLFVGIGYRIFIFTSHKEILGRF